jgi:hypothetical protein
VIGKASAASPSAAGNEMKAIKRALFSRPAVSFSNSLRAAKRDISGNIAVPNATPTSPSGNWNSREAKL